MVIEQQQVNTSLVSLILRSGKDYIRHGWCQHRDAVDKHGNEVNRFSKDAVAWSTCAAVQRANQAHGLDTLSRESYAAMTILRKMANIGDNSNLVFWNDNSQITQGVVLSVFTKAIDYVSKNPDQID